MAPYSPQKLLSSGLHIFGRASEMRHSALALIFLAGFIPAAQAATAVPLEEGNVVEFQVLTTTVPAQLPGTCTVAAMVDRVWEGSAYRFGQPLLLNVPCAEFGLLSANVWSDGLTPVNARTLQQSRRGIARLDDRGNLIWQSANLRQYGQWGAVAGYRVLDLRMLPARPINNRDGNTARSMPELGFQ
jgi:hypothetical protein